MGQYCDSMGYKKGGDKSCIVSKACFFVKVFVRLKSIEQMLP